MAFSLTQVDTAVDTGNSPPLTYSFPGLSLGAAAPTRKIVVGVVVNGAALIGFNSVQVAGISGTRIGGTAGPPLMDFWIANVPTGTTGTVDIDVNTSTTSNCVVVLWRVVEGIYVDGSVVSDIVFTADAVDGSLTIPTNGGGIGLVWGNNGTAPRTWTWTNLTESADATVEGNATYSSALSTTPGTSTRTATGSGPSSISGGLILAAFVEGADPVVATSTYVPVASYQSTFINTTRGY